MKNIFIVIFIFITSFYQTKASHIVGGEITLQHQNGFNYKVRMTLYFDQVNGLPGAEDPEVMVYLWEKRTGANRANLILPKIYDIPVSYTQPECVDARLRTKKIVYETTVFLDPKIYNDQEGYYITWARCCRNYVIDNIYSSDPETGGIGAGQTFYTEFPAVVDIEGNPTQNSSPIDFEPLRDYACVNRYFEADFSGVDTDGDSLVYSLAHPLSVIEAIPTPPPTPAPYPEVIFKPGFSATNMIPGNPEISISENGLIFLNPSLTGLFVFAVKVEEFRNGKKIGEVRRDFQMLIIDCPTQGNKPKLTVNEPETNEITENDIEVVFTGEDQTCLDFFIQDEDGGENVEIKAIPVNFSASDIDGLFSIKSGFLNGSEDTLKTSICIPDCPYIINEPMIIDFVAIDDNCPQPLADTLRISLTIIRQDNVAPDLNLDRTEVTITPGDNFQLPFDAYDLDSDSIFAQLMGINTRDLPDSLKFRYQSQFDELNGSLSWNPQCSDLNPDLSPVSFDMQILVKDDDKCNPKFDTATVSITLADDESNFDSYEPANVITANGDGINDAFVSCEFGNCENSFILPPDNCANQYESITILNRWGQEVYHTKERDFYWDGNDNSAGVYFYEIKYTNRSYKGHISLLRGN
ncbi:gliding motility-associated C-terminal domain-containing protein [Mangrovivirga sp. M17]|uniref:Gliding motility-associated C-terminal domain-containing protein n=1 Tax=Mangrovivirga halotolerans TaxID=2993936 RepID=A0ABT3RNV4_9BACT|nr:gliding motility-associated C-terminal domain-containing protein [Mangrovivirga halotolerans]MCX2743471.1 gliding motility-associated C-terminal domain-containing protein [Mangrovivirga halotolerans]